MAQVEERARIAGLGWTGWVHLAVSVGLLAAAAYLVFTGTTGPPEPPVVQPPEAIQDISDGPVLGERNAPVAVIVYSDFECPVCRRFAQNTVPILHEQFIRPGLALLQFRHYPLQQIHRQARNAAQIAACAHQQGKFWSTHDRFFQLEAALSEPVLRDAAIRAGVDGAALDGCLQNGLGNARVDVDIAAGQAIGVGGTPYILVGSRTGSGVKVSRVFNGLPPALELTRAIAEASGRR